MADDAYALTLLTEINARLNTELKARDKALDLAREVIDTRLKYVDRDITDLFNRIREIEISVSNYAGRFWGVGVLSSLIGAVLGWLVSHR